MAIIELRKVPVGARFSFCNAAHIFKMEANYTDGVVIASPLDIEIRRNHLKRRANCGCLNEITRIHHSQLDIHRRSKPHNETYCFLRADLKVEYDPLINALSDRFR